MAKAFISSTGCKPISKSHCFRVNASAGTLLLPAKYNIRKPGWKVLKYSAQRICLGDKLGYEKKYYNGLWSVRTVKAEPYKY